MWDNDDHTAVSVFIGGQIAVFGLVRVVPVAGKGRNAARNLGLVRIDIAFDVTRCKAGDKECRKHSDGQKQGEDGFDASFHGRTPSDCFPRRFPGGFDYTAIIPKSRDQSTDFLI